MEMTSEPTQKHRTKRARRNLALGAKSKDTTQSNREKDNTDDGLAQGLSVETRGDVEPDTPAVNTMDNEPLAAYKREAPQLLNEVARLLSQHKWTKVGRIPRGIVNILNYSRRGLTPGSMPLKSLEWTDGGFGKLDEEEGASRQVSAKDKREAGERDSRVVGDAGPSGRKPHVGSNTKKRKLPSTAQSSITARFSISSDSCSNPGWIFQLKRPSCDEPQQISLCQWVLARLQAARSPETLQTSAQDLCKSLILRHYGDAKTKLKDRRVRTGRPATLVNGMPRIPEVKQQDPERRKLHYRMEDGSSFIYYPSGCIAVCQSHSGLPCGGFYTNMFSDSKCPAVLATVTASGHGAVTHPHSSAITAVWDQAGGFIRDHHGNITEGWSWQTDRSPREKIIQLSDVISVKLLSGTSGVISFRCNSERVQLPLLALSNIKQPEETVCLRTEGTSTSESAHDLMLVRKTACPAVIRGSRTNLFTTPTESTSTSDSGQDPLLTDPYAGIPGSRMNLFSTPTESTSTSDSGQDLLLLRKPDLLPTPMVQEVEGLKVSLAQWRKRGHVSRDLRRLQQRARNILDGWMDYYHVAVGIKCPDMERMSDAPRRTRLRREVQAAALPSLNPPEQADAQPVQVGEGGTKLLEQHSYLSAPEKKPLASSAQLPRTPKKQTKEEPCVTWIGPVRIHGNFPLESVIIPSSEDLQPPAVARSPPPPAFPPSTRLTVCPALLRAALLGEGGHRRCCCSVALMPVVTDLEYDAFVVGQPPHSQQILVVCTTALLRHVNAPALCKQDVLEKLYRRMNKHRTMPCTQCQMDSFRLVRYEMSSGRPSCEGDNNVLLRRRHSAAPGMALMYIRGKLLFVGHTFSGHSCSIRDLQKQISQIRADYRSGLSLSSDYKISDTVNTPAATDAHESQDAALKAALTAPVEEEKVNERKHHKPPGVSHGPKDSFTKPQKTPAPSRVPVNTH
ncbi:uncharacterized protein C3orf20-like isoform X2 [Clinocottus analis]|uniref:uncharacterized protein C3orf20-like isoform X2 n=1 Tax=Clinocottus analis TaxID=304258 RepID=UPI0035C26D5B